MKKALVLIAPDGIERTEVLAASNAGQLVLIAPDGIESKHMTQQQSMDTLF